MSGVGVLGVLGLGFPTECKRHDDPRIRHSVTRLTPPRQSQLWPNPGMQRTRYARR
jgi:hypothetical protein